MAEMKKQKFRNDNAEEEFENNVKEIETKLEPHYFEPGKELEILKSEMKLNPQPFNEMKIPKRCDEL